MTDICSACKIMMDTPMSNINLLKKIDNNMTDICSSWKIMTSRLMSNIRTYINLSTKSDNNMIYVFYT